MLINRVGLSTLERLAQAYPVIAISGPRQSGKTTLSQLLRPNYRYVSLEDPDTLAYSQADPRGFLEQFEAGGIIDEIQREPKLLSYIQGIVDKKKQMGQFILTGSQQFGLLSNITQSLAGRVGILELLPFSIDELVAAQQDKNLLPQMWQGFYPPVYDRPVDPLLWYADYVRTYIERDVRQLINVEKLSDFQRFMKLCAARTGQLLQYSDLARDADLDYRTVKSWLSILEASYIVFTLNPYYKNYSKRLVKQQKLYFYDTGLVCRLLNIRNAEELDLSTFKGALFETMLVSDAKKINYHRRLERDFYFWRDNKKIEIDLVSEHRGGLHLFEMKSGKTIQNDFFSNLKTVMQYVQAAGQSVEAAYLIYGGDDYQRRDACQVMGWKMLAEQFS
jgi:hypothetical protein